MRHWLEAMDRRATWLAMLLVAFSAWLALRNRFVQDDAWITFRYSANWIAGHGLVWNPGEFVEGYTNFLWVLIMGIPIGLGFDPVISSQAIGIALFTGTLAFAYAFAARLLESKRLALVVVLLLGTNYTFSAYATGGLETQLQVFLVSGGLLCTLWIQRADKPPPSGLLLLSTCLGLGMWTRLDSSLLFAVPYAVVSWRIARGPGDVRRKLGLLLCAYGPAVLLVGGWLTWKVAYYGTVLPNTWYAKAGLPIPLERGLRYVYLFLCAYGLIPFFALAPFALRPGRRHVREHLALAVVLLLWLIYVVRVGGGFMEFRFFVPVLPILFTLLVGTMDAFGRRLPVVLLVLVSLLFSFHHARTFWLEEEVESVGLLVRHLESPDEDWGGIGRALASLFPAPSDVSIATTAAGALPYYAGLRSVDMLGLNDPWVARRGFVQSDRPGHQRLAPLGYLVHRGVNLVVGHPFVMPLGRLGEKQTYRPEDLIHMYIPITKRTLLPPQARMLELPINDESFVAVLYLVPHPEVDRAIAEAGLQTFPIAGVGRRRQVDTPHAGGQDDLAPRAAP